MDDQLVLAVIAPDALVVIVKGSAAYRGLSLAVTLGALLASHHHQRTSSNRMLLFCSQS